MSNYISICDSEAKVVYNYIKYLFRTSCNNKGRRGIFVYNFGRYVSRLVSFDNGINDSDIS